MDISVRGFHFRQSLDVCVSLIARLQSYAKSPTERTDNPIKIRQDLLATSDVIDLALHLRRFAEITNSVARMKNSQLTAFAWTSERELQLQSASLYDLASRIIHSKTCAVYRNLTHVFLHFGSQIPSKEVRQGPWAAFPLLVVNSERKDKEFLSLGDFLNTSFLQIDAVAKNDDEIREYLNRRTI
jgi:hypothetical protein